MKKRVIISLSIMVLVLISLTGFGQTSVSAWDIAGIKTYLVKEVPSSNDLIVLGTTATSTLQGLAGVISLGASGQVFGKLDPLSQKWHWAKLNTLGGQYISEFQVMNNGDIFLASTFFRHIILWGK